jgi:hypothetical protein
LDITGFFFRIRTQVKAETKEFARIGYNGFLFPHSYSGEGRNKNKLPVLDITGFLFRIRTQVKAEEKEFARIGYNGFLFPHSYSGEGGNKIICPYWI